VTAAWRSIFHPDECAILKNTARRSVIEGAQEEEDREAHGHGAADVMPNEGSGELHFCMSTYQDEQEDAEYAPVSPQLNNERAAHLQEVQRSGCMTLQRIRSVTRQPLRSHTIPLKDRTGRVGVWQWQVA
jgi:hypothetical protein